jgi:hypothetical protein
MITSLAMDETILTYNAAQKAETRAICVALATLIGKALPKAENKVWHGGPVWFLEGNPIVGYWVRKTHVQLLFWSGQSFDEPGLEVEGKFKAAHAKYITVSQIDTPLVKRWLRQAKTIQWDYKNLVKRRGVLEKLGSW